MPAYNEEHRLGPHLESYLRYYAGLLDGDFEIIVVVNGSRDATEAVARRFEPAYPQLQVRVEPKPIGKGGALMLGFREASGEWVGFVDADGSTGPEAFEDLRRHAEEADAIIASRWLPESKVHPRQPLKRRIVSRVFNLLVRLLFKLPITDTQCGAKLIRGTYLRQVLPKLGLTRWAFDVDLLFQLRRAHARIREWPTTWSDTAGSKLRVASTSFEMLLAICRLRLLHSPLDWIVRVYDQTLGRLIHLKAITTSLTPPDRTDQHGNV